MKRFIDMNTKMNIPILAGIKYALIFAGIAALMGVIYGAISGIVFVPALFSVTMVGIFATLNFIVALFVFLINLILMIFKKHSAQINRYFGLSLGFIIIYLSFFLLLKVFGIEVF
ncbi:MAG: hypothetical protein AAF696_35410 [Bacteroidota bacterium]